MGERTTRWARRVAHSGGRGSRAVDVGGYGWLPSALPLCAVRLVFESSVSRHFEGEQLLEHLPATLPAPLRMRMMPPLEGVNEALRIVHMALRC